jgi:hypothetical protein
VTRPSLLVSSSHSSFLLGALALGLVGCTLTSGIEDTKREKDKAHTFDSGGSAGDSAAGGEAGAGGGGIDLSGGAGGGDAGAAGDAGDAGAGGEAGGAESGTSGGSQ